MSRPASSLLSTPALLCLLLLWFTPQRTRADWEGDYEYSTDGSTVTIIGYAGPGGAITIPPKIAGLPVATIGNYAFYDFTNLTGVIIPSSVTALEEGAFSKCTGLTNVNIGNSVTTIGSYAFADCTSLPGITIPDSVTTIGSWGFAHCTSLRRITIPDSVTAVEDWAFTQCSGLTNALVGNSVATIGDYVFSDCRWLRSVIFGEGVASVGTGCFSGCLGLTGAYFRGDAPSVGPDAFLGAEFAIIYYLPWATGWGATFGDCPTDLWNLDGVPFRFTATNLTITVTGYTGSGGDATIPTTIDGLPVTGIGTNAFANNLSLTNITVPSSVTNIGEAAFLNCSALRTIGVDPLNPAYSAAGGVLFNKSKTLLIQCPGAKSGDYAIPDSVTAIGGFACNSCVALNRITIGTNVTLIGHDAFAGCSGLTSIAIPDSVTTIGDGAFAECGSLTMVTNGVRVTAVGDEAFVNCGSLLALYFKGNAPSVGPDTFFGADNAIAYYLPWATGWGATWGGLSAELWNLDGVPFRFTADDGTITITEYTGAGPDVAIPATIDGLPVTRIGGFAFSSLPHLNSVSIGNNVTNIGDSAFDGCTNLTTVIISNSVISIGARAFADCSGLTRVFMGNRLAGIGNYAFASCYSLAAVCFQGNVPSADASIFADTDNVTVYHLSTTTGWHTTFADRPTALWETSVPCSYTIAAGGITLTNYLGFGGEVVLPPAISAFPVTAIGDEMFRGCADLSKVTIPSSVNTIGHAAFQDCANLTSLTIPDSVTTMGSEVCSGCPRLSAVSIGSGMRYLSDSGFAYCSNLKTVSIPSSVTDIGEHAFYESGLATLNLPASVRNIGAYAFWKNCLTTLAIPNGVTNVEVGAFAGCANLTNATIGSSVTTIREATFASCSSLVAVTLPPSLTSIEPAAFAWCTSLPEIALPPSVTSIGDEAFEMCTSLTRINIPDGVTVIAAHLFDGCCSLRSITIPNTVVSIAPWAFSGCTNLTSVSIPDSVISIGDCAFSACDSLTSIVIPASVTSIGDWTFFFCTNLKGVYFKGNAPSYGPEVFHQASGDVIVYRRADASGWDTTFAGRQTAFWTPGVLASIQIRADSTTVPENSTAHFSCTATYSDGTTADVTTSGQCQWSILPPVPAGFSISAGQLTSSEIAADLTLSLRAVYTEGGMSATSPALLVTVTNAPKRKLLGMEVTQVIQSWRNDVPLIAGRATVVAAHVVSESEHEQYQAKLRMLKGGTLIKEVDSETVYLPVRNATRDEFQRGTDKHYLKFTLTEVDTEGLSGSYTFQVSGAGLAADAGFLGNQTELSVNATFTAAPQPKVRLIGIPYLLDGTLQNPANSDYDRALQGLGDRLPAKFVEVERVAYDLADDGDWIKAPTTESAFGTVLLGMKEMLELIYGDTAAAGDVFNIGVLKGLQSIQGKTTLGLTDGEVGEPAFICAGYTHAQGVDFGLSHEFGHMCGLLHVNSPAAGDDQLNYPTGYPIAPNGAISISNDGNDAFYHCVLPGGFFKSAPKFTYDLMSYSLDNWPSAFSYTNILKHLQEIGSSARSKADNAGVSSRDGGARPRSPTPKLLISGRVVRNGSSGAIKTALQIESSRSTAPQGNDWEIRLLASDGSQLASHMFVPSFGTEGGDIGIFCLVIPRPEMVARAVLLYRGLPLDARVASPSAPNLSIIAPQGGESVTNTTLHIEWQASDPDGDSLVFTLQFSPDGGNTWRPLGLGLTNRFRDISVTALRGTTNGLIRVLASDGFHTAAAQCSGSFRVPNQPPHVYITSGAEVSVVMGDRRVILAASAYDVEDGALSGSNIVWTSSLDGFLGRGAGLELMAGSLAAGQHIFTATATDSTGNTSSAIALLTIVRDADSDGLPDSWETMFSTNSIALNPWEDLDGDGLTNLQEYQLGRNPVLFDNLRLGLGGLQTNGGFQLSLYGEVGRNYTLEASTNLLHWQSLAHLACTSSPTIYTDWGRSNYSRRFYRIAPLSKSVSPAVRLAAESLSSGGLALQVEGPPALNYRIEASSDLVQWSPLTNFTATGTTTRLLDESATNLHRRFYRAVLP